MIKTWWQDWPPESDFIANFFNSPKVARIKKIKTWPNPTANSKLCHVFRILRFDLCEQQDRSPISIIVDFSYCIHPTKPDTGPFMRMHIDKKLCHFFMVNLSSLLTLIFIEIAWGLFLLLKFKLLVDNIIKNRPKGVPKSQNNFFTFGHNSWWKNPEVLFSKLYTVTKSWISPQQKLGSLWET